MQMIKPNLWFNHNAKEAVDFYTAVFPGSSIGNISRYPNTGEEGLQDFQKDMAGKELTIDFTLGGHEFTAINAGSEFVATPANSFMVYFDPAKDGDARAHLDEVFVKLEEGGTVLMAPTRSVNIMALSRTNMALTGSLSSCSLQWKISLVSSRH